MKVLIVSDAWHPQVNGVVQTLTQVRDRLNARGWEAHVLGPGGMTVACPSYPEIRLTLQPYKYLREALKFCNPNAIHIATEGPLGWAMRSLCLQHKWAFTTSFHTRFPEYLHSRYRIPHTVTYRVLRHFHSKADRTLVPTAAVGKELEQNGMRNVTVWTRGVDTDAFHPRHRKNLDFPRPIQLYVGRVAVEKNLPAFLNMNTPGTKLVVGDGPARSELERRFPKAIFLGTKTGPELAAFFASADVFVFPSITDTFGLVMLEALASGTPVAALPSSATAEVLRSSHSAAVGSNLQEMVMRALELPREACRAYARLFSWEDCADRFVRALTEITPHPHMDRVNEWEEAVPCLPWCTYHRHSAI